MVRASSRPKESSKKMPRRFRGRSFVPAPCTDQATSITSPCSKPRCSAWTVFYGNRDRSMSWIYVDDCVRGILEAAASQNSKGKGYFLSNEQVLTWEDFQNEVSEVVGKRVRALDLPEQLLWAGAFAGEIASRIDKKPRLLNLQKARLGAQQAWTCSSDAARKDFGFDGCGGSSGRHSPDASMVSRQRLVSEPRPSTASVELLTPPLGRSPRSRSLKATR